MSEQELSDEQLEQLEMRMRAKLFGTKKAEPPVFTTAETRIVEKLLGRDNTERLQTRRPDAGRFRPKPVIVTYEYYRTPGDAYSFGTWHINRVENGRPSNHRQGYDEAEFQAELHALRKKGHTVKELRIGFQPDKGRNPRASSQRNAIIDRLKDFRV